MDQKSLGKGLATLIGDLGEAEARNLSSSEIQTEVSKIPIEHLEPNRNQPRKTFDEDSINELAQSIREKGIIVSGKTVKKEDHSLLIEEAHKNLQTKELERKYFLDPSTGLMKKQGAVDMAKDLEKRSSFYAKNVADNLKGLGQAIKAQTSAVLMLRIRKIIVLSNNYLGFTSQSLGVKNTILL